MAPLDASFALRSDLFHAVRVCHRCLSTIELVVSDLNDAVIAVLTEAASLLGFQAVSAPIFDHQIPYLDALNLRRSQALAKTSTHQLIATAEAVQVFSSFRVVQHILAQLRESRENREQSIRLLDAALATYPAEVLLADMWRATCDTWHEESQALFAMLAEHDKRSGNVSLPQPTGDRTEPRSFPSLVRMWKSRTLRVGATYAQAGFEQLDTDVGRCESLDAALLVAARSALAQWRHDGSVWVSALMGGTASRRGNFTAGMDREAMEMLSAVYSFATLNQGTALHAPTVVLDALERVEGTEDLVVRRDQRESNLVLALALELWGPGCSAQSALASARAACAGVPART